MIPLQCKGKSTTWRQNGLQSQQCWLCHQLPVDHEPVTQPVGLSSSSFLGFANPSSGGSECPLPSIHTHTHTHMHTLDRIIWVYYPKTRSRREEKWFLGAVRGRQVHILLCDDSRNCHSHPLTFFLAFSLSVWDWGSSQFSTHPPQTDFLLSHKAS